MRLGAMLLGRHFDMAGLPPSGPAMHIFEFIVFTKRGSMLGIVALSLVTVSYLHLPHALKAPPNPQEGRYKLAQFCVPDQDADRLFCRA
jgi:hypothetical protein